MFLENVTGSCKNYNYEKSYEFAGYGIDAQSVFAEYITKWNIKKGVYCIQKFTGKYFTSDRKQYKGFIR